MSEAINARDVIRKHFEGKGWEVHVEEGRGALDYRNLVHVGVRSPEGAAISGPYPSLGGWVHTTATVELMDKLPEEAAKLVIKILEEGEEERLNKRRLP